MATVQKILGYGGLAKQTAKASPVASPAINGFGVISGQIYSAPITSSYEDITLLGSASDRFSPGVNRTQVLPGANFSTRLTCKSFATWALAALGTDVTSGAGPYVHTETPGLTLPYLTLMGKYGAVPESVQLSDAKVDKLKVSVKGTDPAQVDISLMGCTTVFDFGAWTATNDETVVASMQPMGGTFQIDPAATPAATTIPITAFDLEVNNNLQPVWLSAAITPNDIVEGEQMVSGTATVVVPDLNTQWQAILTGTGAGSTIRNSALYGSLSFSMTSGADIVTFAGLRVEFLCDFPSSDPKGGPAEVTLAWRAVRSLTPATAAFSIVVTNGLTGAPA